MAHSMSPKRAQKILLAPHNTEKHISGKSPSIFRKHNGNGPGTKEKVLLLK